LSREVLSSSGRPAGRSLAGETPASLRSVYSIPSTGGANTTVIVDASRRIRHVTRGVLIKAVHNPELRAAMNEGRTAAGLGALLFMNAVNVDFAELATA